MIKCQIIQNGKKTDEIYQKDGLEFYENHGMERSNSIRTSVVDARLDEWHYEDFGIMHQHYRGKEDNSGFRVMHEVRPALMFTLATKGFGSKSIYQANNTKHELLWHKGNANICFLSGEGGQQVNLNKDLSLDLMSIVVLQKSIEKLIDYDAEIFEKFSPYVQCGDNVHLVLNQNRQVEAAVAKAASDLDLARLMGNNAHRYMQSKVIDCLSGFLVLGSTASGGDYVSLLMRDKMHELQEIIVSRYWDMLSLHDLAKMVGTNECTLKKAFKLVFGTTVFQYLFDYRMGLAVRYLLDSNLPIAEIGIRLGYDYQSHFCTAFKRKYGMSPMEYRLANTVQYRGDADEEQIR